MTNPNHYTATYGLHPRQAQIAACKALACLALGIRVDEIRCALEAALEARHPWTARATWSMARYALKRDGWTAVRLTRSVGYGWWCACWDGENWWSVFVDARLEIHDSKTVLREERRLM